MATLNKEKEDNKVDNNEEIVNLLITDKQFKTAEDFKSEKETLKNKKSDSCQELKNLVRNTKDTISKQTNKFSEGVRSLGNFHNTYLVS